MDSVSAVLLERERGARSLAADGGLLAGDPPHGGPGAGGGAGPLVAGADGTAPVGDDDQPGRGGGTELRRGEPAGRPPGAAGGARRGARAVRAAAAAGGEDTGDDAARAGPQGEGARDEGEAAAARGEAGARGRPRNDPEHGAGGAVRRERRPDGRVRVRLGPDQRGRRRDGRLPGRRDILLPRLADHDAAADPVELEPAAGRRRLGDHQVRGAARRADLERRGGIPERVAGARPDGAARGAADATTPAAAGGVFGPDR